MSIDKNCFALLSVMCNLQNGKSESDDQEWCSLNNVQFSAEAHIFPYKYKYPLIDNGNIN